MEGTQKSEQKSIIESKIRTTKETKNKKLN